jgi:hypothetical protein
MMEPTSTISWACIATPIGFNRSVMMELPHERRRLRHECSTRLFRNSRSPRLFHPNRFPQRNCDGPPRSPKHRQRATIPLLVIKNRFCGFKHLFRRALYTIRPCLGIRSRKRLCTRHHPKGIEFRYPRQAPLYQCKFPRSEPDALHAH